MKTFTEFKQYAVANIKNFLTSDFESADVRIDTINKSTGYNYESLIVSREEEQSAIIPMLNLTQAYDEYLDGKNIDIILQHLADIRLNAPIPAFDREDVLFYERVADRIYPRIMNTEGRADYLDGKPHIEIEDLSVIFSITVEESAEGIATATVTESLLDIWDVTLEEVKERAFSNLKKQTVSFRNIFDILSKNDNHKNIDDFDPSEDLFPLYVLSNTKNAFGANMMLNTSVLDSITDKLGEIIILPSSVNEVIIVPKSTGRDASELAEMVRSVNESEVDTEDQLSNNIYAYDRETKKIAIIR